jgi:hypothetical protein
MKRMTTIFGLVLIQSTAFAGAAFTETTRCSEVGVNFSGQFEISVINSLPDGYSHEVKLIKDGSAKIIGSLNTTDKDYDGNASMEKHYGKFSVEVAGKRGVLTFDGDAKIISTDSHALNLRKATLKVKGLKNQSLLCVAD